MNTLSRQLIDNTLNRKLTDSAERFVTRAPKRKFIRGMSDVQDDDTQQDIRALGRLGWTLSGIQEATGSRRETISGYLKSAGIAVRPRPSGHETKTAISVEVSTRVGPADTGDQTCRVAHRFCPGRTPGPRAQCEACEAVSRADRRSMC